MTREEKIGKILNLSKKGMMKRGFDVEIDLWNTIFNSQPGSIFEFADVVSDFTGWDDQAVRDYAGIFYDRYSEHKGR